MSTLDASLYASLHWKWTFKYDIWLPYEIILKYKYEINIVPIDQDALKVRIISLFDISCLVKYHFEDELDIMKSWTFVLHFRMLVNQVDNWLIINSDSNLNCCTIYNLIEIGNTMAFLPCHPWTIFFKISISNFQFLILLRLYTFFDSHRIKMSYNWLLFNLLLLT